MSRQKKEKSLGEILRALRILKDIPLRKAAAQFEIDQAVLSKIERGLRLPKKELIPVFCEFYNADLDELTNHYLSDKIIQEIKEYPHYEEVFKLCESKIEYGNNK